MKLDLRPTDYDQCRQLLIDALRAARDGFLRSLISLGRADLAIAEVVVGSFGRKRPKPDWASASVLAAFVRDRVDSIIQAQARELGVSVTEGTRTGRC